MYMVQAISSKTFWGFFLPANKPWQKRSKTNSSISLYPYCDRKKKPKQNRYWSGVSEKEVSAAPPTFVALKFCLQRAYPNII